MTRYEPAATNPTATGCQTGTYALGRAIRTVYPELQSLSGPYGCFNRRRARSAATWSLHAEGRALDVGVGPDVDDVGWTLACDLTARHVVLGVQRVMWSGHIWSIEEADRWRRLHPTTDQHLDHIHLEHRWSEAGKPRTIERVYEGELRAGRTKAMPAAT
jgi:hypothetical protein